MNLDATCELEFRFSNGAVETRYALGSEHFTLPGWEAGLRHVALRHRWVRPQFPT
jgi:hypothetical protein